MECLKFEIVGMQPQTLESPYKLEDPEPIVVFPYIVPSFYDSIASLSLGVQALGFAKYFEYPEPSEECGDNGRTWLTSATVRSSREP